MTLKLQEILRNKFFLMKAGWDFMWPNNDIRRHLSNSKVLVSIRISIWIIAQLISIHVLYKTMIKIIYLLELIFPRAISSDSRRISHATVHWMAYYHVTQLTYNKISFDRFGLLFYHACWIYEFENKWWRLKVYWLLIKLLHNLHIFNEKYLYQS